MIDERQALMLVKPLGAMNAQFGQQWEPQTYARVLTTYGTTPESARQAIAELTDGGSDRPTPADVKAALLACQDGPRKRRSLGVIDCPACNGSGWQPVLMLHCRRRGADGRDEYALDRIITASDCSAAEHEPIATLALMRHQRTLQRSLPDSAVVVEGSKPCACRGEAT